MVSVADVLEVKRHGAEFVRVVSWSVTIPLSFFFFMNLEGIWMT